MSSRIVITDDSTGEEIPKGHEYYEVSIRPDLTGHYTYQHYASWGSVLKELACELACAGGSTEITIRKTAKY